jgi:hypothetical protein
MKVSQGCYKGTVNGARGCPEHTENGLVEGPSHTVEDDESHLCVFVSAWVYVFPNFFVYFSNDLSL